LANRHVRYSTAGDTTLRNAQPLLANIGARRLGRSAQREFDECLTMRKTGRRRLYFSNHVGYRMHLALIARSKARTLRDAILEALRQVEGAYSLFSARRKS